MSSIPEDVLDSKAHRGKQLFMSELAETHKDWARELVLDPAAFLAAFDKESEFDGE